MKIHKKTQSQQREKRDGRQQWLAAWGLGQSEVALWRLGEQDQRIEEDGRSAMWVCGGWVGEGEVGQWVSEDDVGLWVGEGDVGGLWWRAVPVSVTSRE